MSYLCVCICKGAHVAFVLFVFIKGLMSHLCYFYLHRGSCHICVICICIVAHVAFVLFVFVGGTFPFFLLIVFVGTRVVLVLFVFVGARIVFFSLYL